MNPCRTGALISAAFLSIALGASARAQTVAPGAHALVAQGRAAASSLSLAPAGAVGLQTLQWHPNHGKARRHRRRHHHLKHQRHDGPGGNDTSSDPGGSDTSGDPGGGSDGNNPTVVTVVNPDDNDPTHTTGGNTSASVAPEPGALALVLPGLLPLGLGLRRRKNLSAK